MAAQGEVSKWVAIQRAAFRRLDLRIGFRILLLAVVVAIKCLHQHDQHVASVILP